MANYKKRLEKLMEGTGITINGKEDWDIQVHDERFYKRVLSHGSMGLGESYMEKWWDCEKPDEFLYRVLAAELEDKVKDDFRLMMLVLKARVFNLQTKSRAQKSISSHYDIGNDLYEKMLDPLMMYSCGYWKVADNLPQAQRHKLELICRKLKIKKGDRVLDIGCGWGGFPYYAAKYHGAEVVGITISHEQVVLAEKRCQGLPVEIRFQDYRDIQESFDKIVSIGMIEHVGHKNYETFMKTVSNNLKPDGIMLLHCIGSNETGYNADPWIDRYIFPKGMLPSVQQLGNAMENYLILQDWHNFGPFYDTTLMKWFSNFKKAWPELKGKYSEVFYRMWTFYLCASAASFRSHRINLWQLVLTHKAFPGGYESVRPNNLEVSD